MNQVNWQLVTPQFDHFRHSLSELHNIEQTDYLELQPRAASALESFTMSSVMHRFLLINCGDNSVFRGLIKEALLETVTNHNVLSTESLAADQLFDTYRLDKNGQIEMLPGQLSQVANGILIVSANMILANPLLWPKIKAAMLGEPVLPKPLKAEWASQQVEPVVYQSKMVITGDRNQLAELDYLDEDLLSVLSMYTELEEDFHLDDDNLTPYIGYLKWLCNRYELPSFDQDALLRLLTAGVRETEDQHYLPLSPLWLRNILSLAAIESDNYLITGENMDRAIEEKQFRESYLPHRAIDDILDGQVIIETTGEQIGQINGLTVIDVTGHPVSYGEPARISCVIHFGDGDVSDVERKAELGGNLHAKGMMIMQAFLSSALRLDEPLPYSASIVFEQSYSEVDGDSASLAELCCLVSALSEQPIDQQIAVTGAVDQFGRVQAVGGLNEKIEGFYQVCKHQGFTGEQGVILPETNLKHLALHKEVVESIKAEEFHIWAVSSIDEVIPLIMGKPFRGEEDSVLSMIAERIENFAKHDHAQGLVERIKNWFV
ncbi:ATP-dependent protease [Vibrio cidicii]|uniref:endopeptidase La n=1 Tax=Vibrio cidicii TaxID=1763883 RepID=A0A151JFK5_9VIBR|nr:Lon protease family protein [Vibrio cidicii]KYN24407.1 ATP-dependent protease [Vibrio cidicii]KYN81242.1 ATP-dependent protease [Vibrio cidicii]MBG0758683.1 ATP-dependent protease [Vibrio cidicii]